MAQETLENLITAFFDSIFQHLELPSVALGFTQTEDYLTVTLSSDPETEKFLIGYQGNVLASLQLLTNLYLAKNTSQTNSTHILVDVGSYKLERQQELEKLALSLAQKVKFSSEPIPVYNLKPFERRFVHLFLVDHPDVITESEGTGIYRHLVIKPRLV